MEWHVVTSNGQVRNVAAVGERFGEVWSVEVRKVKAVGERPGLVGYGEVGCGTGMARFGVALLLTL